MGIESLAGIGLIASIAQGALGAFSAIASGQQASAMASYKAQVAENNAKAAIDAGKAQEEQQRLKTAGMISTQRATAAANNIDVNTGSPLDIQVTTAGLGEMDAQTIRNKALKEAYNYRTQASIYQAEGQNAKAGSYLNAFSSIIGGATSFSDKWNNYKRVGVYS